MSKDSIRKLYIVPTSNCNFNCTMCPRNSWTNEIIGDMDLDTYQALINQAREISSLDTIFFGGVAEPMSHKEIFKMVEMAKSLDVRVELITNGSMINEETIEKLLKAGLDMLWFSIDSAHNDSYDLNVNDKDTGLSRAESNLLTFNYLKRTYNLNAELGIAFVAMKSNIEDLPQIIRLGEVMGAKEIKISNIIPYEKEMQQEMLYQKALTTMGFQDDFKKQKQMVINLPVMDFDRIDSEILPLLLKAGHSVKLGENTIVRKSGHCKFINDGSVFVRWDGEVCPCIALLHNSKAILHDTERQIRFCSYGNINRDSISAIWESEEYKEFRDKVKKFNFSPCTVCGGCSYIESNEEDCFGNLFPVCGGCLWAEGFAQCP